MDFQRIYEESNKNVSCGVILVEDGKFLACHPTGKRYGEASLDIPKGHLEEDEDPRDCMERELYEETSIELSPEEKAKAEDLGEFPYTSYKDLHLFYLETKVPPLDTLRCLSTWDDNGVDRTEVNAYQMVPLDDLSMLFKSLQTSVKSALVSRASS